MKIVKKGNVYKKASWFKGHGEEIFMTLSILVGVWLILTTLFIWG